MAKRDFRNKTRDAAADPDYPTLEDFDANRRRFLGRLGAVFGAGVLGSALSACGDQRRVHTHADGGGPIGPNISGGAPLPPAPYDSGQPDSGEPDTFPLTGDAPAPDARIDPAPDSGPPKPDVEWTVEGDTKEPDARVDPAPDWGIGGGMPAPDAAVDDPDMMPSPGIAPAPDAAIDGGSCPNP